MSKILTRDEFINEIYSPMKEEKEYRELQKVNEGLLKNLFGMVKNMFKKDWENVKGDNSIIQAYKEMDDKLTGFTTMKMSKRDQCNKIRQELVDFACDWYDYKMNKSKDSGDDPKIAKSMKFKDDTLRENLEKCQKKIKEIAGEDNQMITWANTLMDDMKSIINKVILSDIEDEETKKEIEKQNAEELKKQEVINKKMEEFQKTQLDEIEKEREQFLSDVEATPVKIDLLGDKAIQNLCGEFEKFNKEKDADKRKDLFQKDVNFGFKSLFEDDDFGKKEFKTSYKLMGAFYAALGATDVVAKFKEVPGQSVQAMCISVNSFIKNCVFGSQDYGKALPLMAKCAIVSDGTVSYNLPVNDKGDGNYYTDIMGIISKGEFNKDVKGKEIKLPDDFKKNADALLNKIVTEAKKLKEDAEKKYNDEMKKFKLETEEESNIE